MLPTAATLLTLLVAVGPFDGATNRSSVKQVQIKHCLVSSIEEARVPAQESGPLIQVAVKEGAVVVPEQLLALINDQQARLDKQAAEMERTAAMSQAMDDIEIRYAEASFEVAVAELQQNLDIISRVPGSVPVAEIRRLKLTKHRAELQIDRAKLDLKIAKLNANVEDAKVKSTDGAIQRRRINSPIGGTVVAIYRQKGEWVAAGEAVVHVVRMDELYVEGFISAADYNPSELNSRSVTVIVPQARGRKVQLTGKAVFVSPLVQAGDKYRLRAVVKNRKENGHWLLRPGSSAVMTILLP